MHFRYHKWLLKVLIVVELLLAFSVEIERQFNLHLLMGMVYFLVSFWFVFGDRKWWLYQLAGVGYVVFVIFNRIMFVFQIPYSRSSYHLTLAAFWGVILLIHLFVERNIGPPTSPPSKRHPEQYFPDDDDDR